MTADVWLSWRDPALATDRLQPTGFRCEWHAHAMELHARSFYSYREAIQFAERKVGKSGAIFNDVPRAMRAR